jgi:DNA topoisomerase-3
MPDLSGKEPVGPCPKCGARVFELDMAYACEKALGPAKTCDFRSGKIILQRPIEREQMEKLLTSGKTDLLTRFISKKGRPFQAFLAKGPDGAVRFEFAPRAAKSPKRAAAAGAEQQPADALAAPAPRAGKAARSQAQAAAKEAAPVKATKKAATKKAAAKTKASKPVAAAEPVKPPAAKKAARKPAAKKRAG